MACQFFYGFLAIHSYAQRQHIEYALNEAPLFWNTILGALQQSALITLGRIFDKSSKHNVRELLSLAENHVQIFSRPALKARKMIGQSGEPDWLAQYVAEAYEPTKLDLRRLAQRVNKHRATFEMRYKPLRDKIYAHKVLDGEAARVLYSKTRVGELQNLLLFLVGLYNVLWELLYNGRQPKFRRYRKSAAAMRAKPTPKWHSAEVHETIFREARDFFAQLKERRKR